MVIHTMPADAYNIVASYKSGESCESIMEKIEANPEQLNTRNGDGWKLIHVAAFKGDIELLNSLVEYEANINDFTLGGSTAASIAVQYKNLEFLNHLRGLGADLSAKEGSGFSALFHLYASTDANVHSEAVNYVLNHPEARDALESEWGDSIPELHVNLIGVDVI